MIPKFSPKFFFVFSPHHKVVYQWKLIYMLHVREFIGRIFAWCSVIRIHVVLFTPWNHCGRVRVTYNFMFVAVCVNCNTSLIYTRQIATTLIHYLLIRCTFTTAHNGLLRSLKSAPYSRLLFNYSQLKTTFSAFKMSF